MHIRMSAPAVPALSPSYTVNGSREIERHELLPDDIFQLSEGEMCDLVTSKASAWQRPQLDITYLRRYQETLGSLPSIAAESAVGFSILGNDTEHIKLLPNWTLSDLNVHPTCAGSVSSILSTVDTMPSQGANTCALDACLVLGRLMRVGLSSCDQMAPMETRQLAESHPLTYWMRATIARSWHNITQHDLSRTRDTLADLVRRRKEASETERRGGYMRMDVPLNILLEGCRSASWTQKPGWRCPACSFVVLARKPTRRLLYSGLARGSWPETWRARVGEPFQPQSDEGGRPCGRCDGDIQMARVAVVLDRLPPYLVLNRGFDALQPEPSSTVPAEHGSRRTRETMFDDMDIHYIRDGGAPRGVISYRWVGILELESSSHFRLYWKQDDGTVAIYDGITGRPTFQTFAQMRAALLGLNLSVVIYRAYKEPGEEPKHEIPLEGR
ncbi:MAG: hypothetical protein Q9218_003212 [Villophora microphyllina]